MSIQSCYRYLWLFTRWFTKGRKRIKSEEKSSQCLCYFTYENWDKAFGLENIAPRITVSKKIRAGLESHFNSVLCKRLSALSKRERLRQWRKSPKVNCLLDILKSTSDPNSFDENEKLFYFTQKATSRIGCISKEIDIPYEISKEKELQQMVVENDLYLSEISYINDTSIDDINAELSEVTPLNSTLTEPSMNRSGTVRIEENTGMKIPQPEIRKLRNFAEKIKSACAKTSSSCGVSVDKARIAVQVVCNELYQYKYYLSKEEHLNSVDVDQISMDISCNEPIAKRAHSETNSKTPKNQQ